MLIVWQKADFQGIHFGVAGLVNLTNLNNPMPQHLKTMKKKKFEIYCKSCKKEVEIVLENDGGCDDNECCGGRSYYIEITCGCGTKHINHNL